MIPVFQFFHPFHPIIDVPDDWIFPSFVMPFHVVNASPRQQQKMTKSVGGKTEQNKTKAGDNEEP